MPGRERAWRRENTSETKEIFEYLNDAKKTYLLAKNNEEIYSEKDIKIKTFKPNFQDDNESSIVTLLTYQGKNFLFMADSSAKGYENIKNLLPSDVEIIKIGHHGAKNSINNEMIKQLKPKYALISAGHKFNHPHIDVVEILDKNNVKMISTKNYGFSKIVLKDNFEKIYYFDNFKNTLREIHFKNSESLPFYKSDFMNEIIQKATKNH